MLTGKGPLGRTRVGGREILEDILGNRYENIRNIILIRLRIWINGEPL